MDSISFKSDQSQGNRLSIHLDAVGGISGDMFASAFLDLNPELMVAIKESVDEMGVGDELRVENKAFSDGVLKGQRFLVDEGTSESSNHTPWKVIRERLIQSGIKQEIRENALGIFKCLAEAEALVHGIDVEEVVFHEVGAVDSMVDVLAASVILDAYHEANWFLGSLPLGRGEVQTAHGKLPLPAPAVVELLKGFDFHDDGETGERVTPTGAAILRFLTENRGLSQKPETFKRKLLSSGQGFGSRKLKTKSNLLRILVFGPEETSPEEDRIAVLGFEVDDQTVENPESAMSELIEQNRDQVDDSMLSDVDRFVDEFKRNHGFELRIRKPAKVALVKLATDENRSVLAFCEKKFSDFQHGLSIISQRTGKKSFVIDRKAIDDPDKELSKWVVDSFGKKPGEGE